MQTRIPTPARCLIACSLLFIFSGCAGSNLLNWKREKVPTADEKNPAVDILCLWQPAEGSGVDGLPTRGVAGQILFFTGRDASPVVVNGDVRIYMFDDQGSPEEQAKPIRQFDFVGKAWNKHARSTTFGPAYQVFLPYARDGLHKVHCSLRVRLEPKDGRPVYSKMEGVTLPGSKDDAQSQEASGSKTAVDRFVEQARSRSAEPKPIQHATLSIRQRTAGAERISAAVQDRIVDSPVKQAAAFVPVQQDELSDEPADEITRIGGDEPARERPSQRRWEDDLEGNLKDELEDEPKALEDKPVVRSESATTRSRSVSRRFISSRSVWSRHPLRDEFGEWDTFDRPASDEGPKTENPFERSEERRSENVQSHPLRDEATFRKDDRAKSAAQTRLHPLDSDAGNNEPQSTSAGNAGSHTKRTFQSYTIPLPR